MYVHSLLDLPPPTPAHSRQYAVVIPLTTTACRVLWITSRSKNKLNAAVYKLLSYPHAIFDCFSQSTASLMHQHYKSDEITKEERIHHSLTCWSLDINLISTQKNDTKATLQLVYFCSFRWNLNFLEMYR